MPQIEYLLNGERKGVDRPAQNSGGYFPKFFTQGGGILSIPPLAMPGLNLYAFMIKLNV